MIFKNKILNKKDKTILIPRMPLIPSDTNLPFEFQRIQFPIRPAFAITFNKSQGQTFDQVGVYLDKPVFSHGQLYVALSRCRNRNKIKVHIKTCTGQGVFENRWMTRNIVYKEIFD